MGEVAHIDDPCGSISVHGLNGLWGVLAVGIFADGTYGSGWNGVSGNVKGLLYGDGGQFLAQMAHAVVGFAWAFGATWVIFKVVKQFIKIRVSPQVEIEGLDMAEFGAVCYPDFVLSTTHGGGTAGAFAQAGLGAPVGPPTSMPSTPSASPSAPSEETVS